MRILSYPGDRRLSSCLLIGVSLFQFFGLPMQSQGDAVTDWNSAVLNAIKAERTVPPRASRALALTHAAIYDTVNSVERRYQPYHVSTPAPAGISLPAAVATAAYVTATNLFTNAGVQQTNLLALYEAQLSPIFESTAKDDGIFWGRIIAQTLLASRVNDGSTAVVPYQPSSEAGHWRPTLPANAAALLPGWGQVKPFAMITGSEFRPQPPPPIGSVAYAFEYNTVKAVGGTTSAQRTANQTEVALFWNDGAGTVTPPGHWNVIAQTVSRSRNLSLPENARLFALLNLAMADAAICAWDAKYVFDLWRPITAIREAGSDGNAETEPDFTWTPLIPTPPFPEYTSGHSTFSRSAATVLAEFFGTDEVFFIATSDGLPGVSRRFRGFSEAADEAGISRLYGGIHWPSANLHGQSSGGRIGQRVMEYLLRPVDSLKFSFLHHENDRTRLALQGEPNKTYLIRASTDLKTWETIATVTSPTGTIHFTDPNVTRLTLRFYEAIDIRP